MAYLEVYRPRQLTRWQRMRETLRAYRLGPWSTKDPELAKHMGGGPVSAGVSVSEVSALNYAAVWDATNIISSDIASVPLPLYRRTDDGRGKERFSAHPLYRIIHDQPNPHMGSQVFRKTLQAHALVWGNGYAEIERDQGGRPKYLWPLLPNAVQPLFERGRLRYRVYNPTSDPTMFDAADIIHIRGMGWDGIQGYSVIGHARESVGLGVAAERFGATFFGNGSVFGGVISYPAGIRVDPQTKKENKEALDRQHQGVEKAHRWLALYEGATYTQLGVPPNAAQFLETRYFQIEEVCRWFNLPPHKLKHLQRSTNNNIEHQGIEYDTDTLNPWWVNWEQELNIKLVAPLERGIQLIEHERKGRMQGDSAARGTHYSQRFSLGSITPNEIRAKENENPLKGGDRAFVPFNMIPMDRVDEWFDAEIASKKAKSEPPPQANPDADRKIPELEEQLAVTRKTLQEAEDARDLARHEARLEKEKREVVEYGCSVDREAHEAALAELQRQKAFADDALEQATRARQEADERAEAVSTELAEAVKRAAQTDEALALARSERDAFQAETLTLRDTYEKGLAEVQSDLDAARAETEQAKAQVVELTGIVNAERAAHAKTDQQRLEAEEQREHEHARYVRQCELTASAVNDCDAVKADLAAVAVELEASQALATETEQARQASELGRVETRAMLEHVGLELAATRAERDAARVDLVALRQQAAGAELALEIEREHARSRRAALLASMRSLFVEASERLLQRESDRARKHQATPEKFRVWLESYYPLHEDVVRAAFRPLVGPWTVIAGGESDALLDRLVAEHVDESTTAMRLVLDADDDDGRAALLERTLRRWDTERADAMADALLKEGMAGNG